MINNLLVQPSGKILISGELSRIANVTTTGVTRIDEIGEPDRAFLSPVMGPSDSVSAMTCAEDGSIVIGGEFMTDTSAMKYYIVGLDAEGTVEDWFEAEYPDGKVLVVETLQDGKILAGGEFKEFRDQALPGLTLLNDDGTINQDFFSGMYSL